MAKQYRIHLIETVDAPIEQVFEFFADHERFVGLFGGSCKRVVDGADEPNGLGSVRRIGPGPLGFDETIVVFERPNRIHYQITRGGPLTNHLGEIAFASRGNRTEVDYRIRFESKLPFAAPVTKAALERAWARNARAKLDRIGR